MRVLDQDTRLHMVKLRPDTLDDLWHLSHIVAPGDRVTAQTYRRQEARGDRVRETETARVPVVLSVRAETVEFHESSARLRVLGPIEDGPDDLPRGDHHTLSLGEHDWVEVVKPNGWPHHTLQRVREAVDATKEPRVTIVAMDDDEGTVAVLHQFGVREIGTKRRAGGGKQYRSPDERETFYRELREVLATTAPEGCPVIVVGPGFARENFVKHLQEHPVDRVGQVVTEPASHPGMSGVHEAIRRGVVRRVADRSRLSAETEAVEELLARIGAEGRATYGPREVEVALNLGAVERLLVLDTLMRAGDVGPRLLDVARATAADAIVIGSGHEAGRRLAALTGVAALLRFKTP